MKFLYRINRQRIFYTAARNCPDFNTTRGLMSV